MTPALLSSSRDTFLSYSVLMLGSACAGAALALTAKRVFAKRSPETDHSIAHDLVWKNAISGALNAAMMYVGDRLDLYAALREECKSPGSSVTAIGLAKKTGLNQRWLREWLAQQAAMGVLTLLPGVGDDDASLHYRIPAATAEVLADETSKEYDISMIQAIPSLVNRAKTMLPEAMKTGIGRHYDEVEISEAIDRHHKRHIRDIFLPNVLTKAMDGKLVDVLEKGCKVVDLGCGAGTMLISLAKRFPNSTFHGFEISTVALEKAAFNVASARIKNVFLHDAKEDGESLASYKKEFDLAVVYDVLHDAVSPMDLIQQVKGSLKSDGVWLLADIPCAPTVRDNLRNMFMPGNYFGFSLCLCMSCALSEEGGAGLGTLGFSVPLAKKMLIQAGFKQVDILSEKDNARWFLVR